MRYAFVCNPAAANGRAARRIRRVVDAVQAAGLEAVVMRTERPGHAVTLAAEAARQYDAVVAVGGDGTLHEVARGLVSADAEAALGVLPFGTGNDFAALVGMPPRAADCVAVFAAGRTRPFDAGRVRFRDGADEPWTEGFFVNAIGIGFDALAADLARGYKALGGKAAYVAAIVKALRIWEHPPVTVEDADGAAVYAGPLHLACFANGSTVGGGFRLTPDAVPDDALLDACVVEGASAARTLQMVPRVIRGAHTAEPEVTMGRSAAFRLRSGAPLYIHGDGENLTRTAREVEVSAWPAALRVIVPGAA